VKAKRKLWEFCRAIVTSIAVRYEVLFQRLHETMTRKTFKQIERNAADTHYSFFLFWNLSSTKIIYFIINEYNLNGVT
jgi:hypothetical protein